MRSVFLAFAFTISGLSAAPPANARIDVDPATGRITCTTAYGQYDRRPLVSLAEGGRLAGRVRLVAPAEGGRWAPAAGFLFRGASRHNAGAEIVVMPDDRENIYVALRLPGTSAPSELGTLPNGQWVPLSVFVSEDGLLTVAIGERVFHRRVRLERPYRPVLICNSGTFEFELAPGMRLADPPPTDG